MLVILSIRAIMDTIKPQAGYRMDNDIYWACNLIQGKLAIFMAVATHQVYMEK